MSWNITQEAITLMPLDKINQCIEEYKKQHIIFSDHILEKILAECESWKNDWFVTFRKQLRRIKKGEGTPAFDKENGMRVTDPLVKNRFMAMYFKRQANGSCHIYNFKLEIYKI